MSDGYPTKIITEGKAKLIVPKLDDESGEPLQHLRSKAPVFYNPVMKVNRDTAVLVLRSYQKTVDKPVSVCEPMTGSGVRGIRFLLETHDVEHIVLNDLNPSAIKLARRNAHLNRVEEKINLREIDANLLLSLHSYPRGRFDYVDIDPYGSPAPFIDAVIMATKNHGIIAMTATDMAPLCGVNKKACLRKYGGWPLHGEFCHETALRLMIGNIIKRSAVYEYGATTIFSYYSDHYIRAYYKLDKGAKRADEKLTKIGYIHYCPKCLHRETSRNDCSAQCPCGEDLLIGGPLWLGELSDPEYMRKMMIDIEKLPYLMGIRTEDILRLVQNEYGYPVGFFVIDSICKLVGIKSIATIDVIDAIKMRGFRVTQTHFNPRGIKTDASAYELVKIFKQFKR